MRMTDLKPGWAVVGNDGQRIRTVRAVGQNYVVASRVRRAGDIYVPASAIANVERDVVHLNLAKREAESMGWEQPPRDDDQPTAPRESDLHQDG